MDHSATYSPDDNKLRLYPACRLSSDEYDRVKTAGFKWAPKQELFVAPMWTPQREDLLIEMCGEIGDEDTSLVERAEERAERFEDYSAKRLRDAEQAKAAVSAIAEGIPLGQPILVGHHSERRARKDAERIQSGMRRAVANWKTSQYWTARAAGAISSAKYKELPAVRHRRIKGIESDKRKAEQAKADAAAALAAWTACANEPDPERQKAQALRLANRPGHDVYLPRKEGDREDFPHAPRVYDALAGSCPTLYAPRTLDEVFRAVLGGHPRIIANAERWIGHYDNRLAYERAMLGEQTGVSDLGARWNITPGGRARIGREWLPVLRVNKSAGKVVSITTTAPAGVTWQKTWKYGVEEVSEYREPTAEDADAAKAATAKAPLCNYPGEGFEHITAEQWKRKYAEGKWTATIAATDTAGAHRVRKGHFRRNAGGDGSFGYGAVLVYITDQKRIDPPAPKGEPPPTFARQIELPEPRQSATPDPEISDREDFHALESTLRGGGVQVISAPQLFPTPPDLARRMVDAAEIEDNSRVLEPSAGTGNIVAAIRERYPSADVEVVEINDALAAGLRERFGIPARSADFLGCNGDLGRFDRVLMNPPFAAGADIEHVRHAYGYLRPGGVLVAIMCAGPFFRQDRKSVEFRDWLADLGSEVEDLPADSFKASGTSVSAKLVVIRAPWADRSVATLHRPDQQTEVPGAAEWREAEANYQRRLDCDRATLALASPLAPTAKRKADALPLFDPPPARGLFE